MLIRTQLSNNIGLILKVQKLFHEMINCNLWKSQSMQPIQHFTSPPLGLDPYNTPGPGPFIVPETHDITRAGEHWQDLENNSEDGWIASHYEFYPVDVITRVMDQRLTQLHQSRDIRNNIETNDNNSDCNNSLVKMSIIDYV